MLIHREFTISKKNLKEKSYTPQQIEDKEIKELSPQEKEDFFSPAVELLYSIYNEGGFDQDGDN